MKCSGELFYRFLLHARSIRMMSWATARKAFSAEFDLSHERLPVFTGLQKSIFEAGRFNCLIVSHSSKVLRTAADLPVHIPKAFYYKRSSPMAKVKLSEERYEEKLHELQVELCLLQRYVRERALRIVVIFEGRDAAGKGGVIKRITERVSPRVFRVVALPAPTDREKTQLYLQRYIPHLPAGGEVILFDRSWYNRAGVEKVMGFCTEKEYEFFLGNVSGFEEYLVENGIILIKYFFDVSQKEQEKRFLKRLTDPRRQWKLSPMDVESYQRWHEYTAVYDRMIRETDHAAAPWYRVQADNKKKARLNCISHLLSVIDYEKVKFDAPDLGKRNPRKKGTPKSIGFKYSVPERY
jgi:polyphosphate kinase 2